MWIRAFRSAIRRLAATAPGARAASPAWRWSTPRVPTRTAAAATGKLAAALGLPIAETATCGAKLEASPELARPRGAAAAAQNTSRAGNAPRRPFVEDDQAAKGGGLPAPQCLLLAVLLSAASLVIGRL